ncbi:MAG: phosphotransferase, partial [Gammaproteobacteria bacterium]|nr:phosphotransferase [Gammaproteobacteria bacterium]
FRSYYRVMSQGDTKIIMDAPPQHEPLTSFLDVTKRLALAKINVPIIYEVDESKGYILMSDLGKNNYLDALNKETVYCLYTDAIDVICRIQNEASSKGLEVFDMNIQIKEMDLFKDWFLEKHLKMNLNQDQSIYLKDFNEILARRISKIPTTFIHRDFHSRNLMVTDKNNPGVLDYQDAMIGPMTYDLVSLLKDCYIKWDDELIYKMVKTYFQRLEQSITYDEFEYWFDMTGLQRHLKAIGIFSRLYYRDQKSLYLKDIPKTLNYIVELCTKYPELHEFQILVKQIKNQGKL